MGISDLGILCVAVVACGIGLGSSVMLNYRLAVLKQAQPAAAHRQAAEQPDRQLPERFMVIDGGCALSGRMVRRKMPRVHHQRGGGNLARRTLGCVHQI